MTIVRLKTFKQVQPTNELLKLFGLPRIEYPKGYQAKPTNELTGGSVMSPNEALGLKAVNELRRWAKRSIVVEST